MNCVFIHLACPTFCPTLKAETRAVMERASTAWRHTPLLSCFCLPEERFTIASKAVLTCGMDAYPRQYLYRRIVKAKVFIDAQFSSAIDLDNIADEACFSKFHFVRLFKSIYGKTPHQYLTGIRVDRASEMLAKIGRAHV